MLGAEAPESASLLAVGSLIMTRSFPVNTEHVAGSNSRNIKWRPIIKLSLIIFGKVKSRIMKCMRISEHKNVQRKAEKFE